MQMTANDRNIGQFESGENFYECYYLPGGGFSQQSYSVPGKSLLQLSSPHVRPSLQSWSKSQSPSPMLHFSSFVLQQVTSVLRAVHLGS